MKALNKTLELAKETGDKDAIAQCYADLAETDSAKGDYNAAGKNYLMYIVYRDSIITEQNTKKSMQINMEYEFIMVQKRDSIENAMQEKQEELKHEREMGQQRTYLFAGLIALVVLIIGGIWYRANKKQNKIY